MGRALSRDFRRRLNRQRSKITVEFSHVETVQTEFGLNVVEAAALMGVSHDQFSRYRKRGLCPTDRFLKMVESLRGYLTKKASDVLSDIAKLDKIEAEA